jgi:PBSX family phage terminase large subunit
MKKLNDVLSLFSRKQIDSINESTARINIWEGAVRSGKTYASLWRFLFELANGPAGDYAIITRTYDTFRRNILDQLMTNVGADVQYYAGRREINLWGKTVHVIGCDNERAEAKIRGASFCGSYVDETTIIPESVFKQLISRCVMGEAKIFATTNPDSPYHWLKRDYIDGNPDVKSWQFVLEDNPELTQEKIDYLKRQYKGLWYQRFIQGLWVQAEGAIYDFFDPSIHCIDFAPPMAEYYICGVDYGTTNPTAFTLIGVNRNIYPNMWVESIYYYDSRIKQRQKTDTEYADDLKKFLQGRHVKAVYIDPSAASFKLECQREGINNLFEAKNEVLDGIRQVAKYLNNGTLKICRCCDELIKEFQSYVWDPKCAMTGIDKPLKQSDHLLDSCRYAIYSHFFESDGKHMTSQELDKNYFDSMGYDPNNPFMGPMGR